MPMLEHFTEEQKDEIRSEIRVLLRPYRIRAWLMLIGLILGLVLGLEAYNSTQANTSTVAIRVAHTTCVNDHQLLIDVILRSVNATYAEYMKSPFAVLAQYRKELEANTFLQHNQDLIEKAVSQTHDILQESDPKNCL